LYLRVPNSTLPAFTNYSLDPVTSHVIYDAKSNQNIATNVSYGVLSLDSGFNKTVSANLYAYDISIDNATTLVSDIPGPGTIEIKRSLVVEDGSSWSGGDDNVGFWGDVDGLISYPNGSLNFYDVTVNKTAG
jgi:hypothetical protein